MFVRSILFLTLSLGTAAVRLGGVAHAEPPPLETNQTETIIIRDPIPPVWPKPKKPTRTLPAYSDEAIQRDAWTRAWMLLDIDTTGRVTAVKFLKRPGYDLESIAVAEAFKGEFEPARSATGDAVRVRLVWLIEWPSHGWMRKRFGFATRKPPNKLVEFIPCAGSGPWRMESVYKGYRDCSKPDLSKVESERWIHPPPPTRD